MKQALVSGLVVCLVLAACGGQDTPDPTIVARAVESTLAAQSTQPPTSTGTPIPSATLAPPPTETPSATATPSAAPTPSPTAIPTATPTAAPTVQVPDEWIEYEGLDGLFTLMHPPAWNLIGQDKGSVSFMIPGLAVAGVQVDEKFLSDVAGEDDETIIAYLVEAQKWATPADKVFELLDKGTWNERGYFISFSTIDEGTGYTSYLRKIFLLIEPEGAVKGTLLRVGGEIKEEEVQTMDTVLSTVEVGEPSFQVISPTSAAEPTRPPTPTPSQAAVPVSVPGSLRANPVPFGVKAQVTRYGGKGVFEVAVVDVIRGERATQMMLDANMFNGVPEDPALEWMLVRMKGKCVQAAPEFGTSFGASWDMRIYADQRRVGQPLGGIPPEPELHGVYFAGADIDGWVEFFVYKDDPRPLLFVEENWLDLKEGTWFALSSSIVSTGAPYALVGNSAINVREGPGTVYPIVGTATAGSSFQIIGRNEASDWWHVCCIGDRTGWVAGTIVTMQGDRSHVPVAGDIPEPPAAVRSDVQGAQPSESASTRLADSLADFTGYQGRGSWWFLYSVGSNNFEWREMKGGGDQPDCYRCDLPDTIICADFARPSFSGDVALQYKSEVGGTVKIEVELDLRNTVDNRGVNVYLYRHLQQLRAYRLTVANTQVVDSIVQDVTEGEFFFLVFRANNGDERDEVEFRMRVSSFQ